MKYAIAYLVAYLVFTLNNQSHSDCLSHCMGTVCGSQLRASGAYKLIRGVFRQPKNYTDFPFSLSFCCPLKNFTFPFGEHSHSSQHSRDWPTNLDDWIPSHHAHRPKSPTCG